MWIPSRAQRSELPKERTGWIGSVKLWMKVHGLFQIQMLVAFTQTLNLEDCNPITIVKLQQEIAFRWTTMATPINSFKLATIVGLRRIFRRR